MKSRIVRILPAFVGMLLFGTALWVLHRELTQYHFSDIRHYLAEISAQRIAVASLLTIAGYLLMSGYDILALRAIKHPLACRKVVLGSFVGYAFSNNIGMAMLAGASVRYTLYSAWGLTPAEIARIIAFCAITLWLGFFSLGGVLFLAIPLTLPAGLHFPFASLHLLGMLFVLCVAAYLVLCVLRRKPLKLFGRTLWLPEPGLLFPQIIVAVCDWAMAGAVLYVLLPSSPSFSYPVFLAVFLIAQLAGLASQLPGGIGVFETVCLLLLKPYFPVPQILGSLAIFRVVYYLLPLVLAAVLLGGFGLRRHQARLRGILHGLDSGLSMVAPRLFSLAAFAGGIVLLFSGATPAMPRRLAWLEHFVPLAFTETFHFVASLMGVGLLILARGLQRRLDGAYLLTLLLLAAGAVFSLLKGIDYEEAILLAALFAALLPCRRHFYRKAALLSQPFTFGWITAITLVISATTWLIFFSYKHVAYSHELWWRFAFSADAPRSLRSMVGVVTVAGCFALARLLRPRPPRALISPADPGDISRAKAIVARADTTSANLALLGDKRFLFSNSGESFLMYGIRRKSWVAMGDPVGPVNELPELIWQFKEMSDRHGGWPVFYETSHKYLHYYVDIGLTLFKLGEEARVLLDDFTLNGRSVKGLRYTKNRFEKDGWRFSVAPREDVPGLLPDLQAVSDAWLARKQTREKGFSLGFFDPEYLKHFPVALVKKGDKIYAFANIWQAAAGNELSIDLMRHLAEAPSGVMDFLFIHLMLWGKEKGFRRFNLGMAPLAGVKDHALAPLWNRTGAFIFRHGEHFYNFQGLRRYKEKFHPVWEPRYLAAPGRVQLLPVLIDIAVLVSGGIKGVIGE
ncbi:MAG: bifunctional lysylphosphatidylglycerol flippase/synthetase MprF [Desulfobacterales bacterium]|nr:bifunctional lysylphosphatidylglycerol flippase/synthetase MprF [Desulfobacterales bacterium]